MNKKNSMSVHSMSGKNGTLPPTEHRIFFCSKRLRLREMLCLVETVPLPARSCVPRVFPSKASLDVELSARWGKRFIYPLI